MNYEFECDTCGTQGTTDDGISDDGDDCPDENCPGTVYRLHDCPICGKRVYEEEGHAYHEPSCAVIRGAWQTEQFSGHDYEIQELHCRCDGYVHDHCCSVCFVGALLAPVHKFLYDRENA